MEIILCLPSPIYSTRRTLTITSLNLSYQGNSPESQDKGSFVAYRTLVYLHVGKVIAELSTKEGAGGVFLSDQEARDKYCVYR